MANRKEYELAIRIMGIMDSSFGQTCNLTKKQIREVAKAAVAAGQGTVSFGQALTQAGPGIDKAWNGLVKTAKVGLAATTAVGAAMVAAGKASVDVGSEFDKAMSSWKGTASATDAEFQLAREEALKWGRQTTKTATEGANALEYMALAGWNVQDSVSALPRVLKLSEATGLDLARTSDLVTDSMSATGEVIGKNGEGLEHFLNVATKANNTSNQTAEMLMEAWIKTGGIFKNLSVDVEDSATALGILANRGIKGEEAGTKLKALMTNLTTGAGAAGKMMEKLNVQAFDDTGKFKGLKEVLQEVNQATKDLTQEERNAAFAAIGGKRHVDAMSDLMQGLNKVAADGRSEWDSLNQSLRNANGSLDRMAATKMDNLWGDLKIAQSALQDTGIKISDGLTPVLREVVTLSTKLTLGVGDFAGTFTEAYPTIRRVLKEGSRDAMNFASPLLKLGKFTFSNPEWFLGSVAGIGTTIGVLKGVKEGYNAIFGSGRLVTSLVRVNGALQSTTQIVRSGGLIPFITALGSNPMMLAVTGVAALAGGLVSLKIAMDAYDRKIAAKNLKEHFGEIALSLEELGDVAESILGKQTFERLGDVAAQVDKVKTAGKELSEVRKELNKFHWRVDSGLELSNGDIDKFKESVNSLVQKAQNYLSESRYSLNLSISALFDDTDPDGSAILNNLTGVYDSMESKLKDVSYKLGKAMNDAISDGAIDTDESKLIAAYEEQIANITDKLNEYKQSASLKNIFGEFDGQKLTSDSFKNLSEKVGEHLKTNSENISKATESARVSNEAAYGEHIITKEEYEAQDYKITQRQKFLNANAYGDTMRQLSQSILRQYSDETSKALAEIPERAAFMMKNDLTVGMGVIMRPEEVRSSLGLDEIQKSSKNAIKELWKSMKPSFDEMQEVANSYRSAGMEIPKALSEGLRSAAEVGSIAEDANAIYEIMLEEANNNPEYMALLSRAKEQGADIPKALADGINDPSKATAAVDSLWSKTRAYVNAKGAQALAVNQRVEFHLQSGGIFGMDSLRNTLNQTINSYGFKPYGVTVQKPMQKKFASGGVVDRPTDALIGEGGDTEFIIPVNQSARSRSLWESAGAALGAVGNDSGRGSSFVYSPSITVQGNADASMLQKVMNDSAKEFEARMWQYEKDRRRTSM